MGTSRIKRSRGERIPLTVALDPQTFAFLEECARRRHFKSVDSFFDAALSVFRKHIHAVDAYLELEESKGHAPEDVLRSAECEILFTKKRR
jgi:hypothetical protein